MIQIELRVDNTPTEKSQRDLNVEIKRKRVNLMQVCREQQMLDVYNQFVRWLRGIPNQKNWKRFVRALKNEEIIEQKIIREQ